jgi:transcription elongation GreA/GreB family factor
MGIKHRKKYNLISITLAINLIDKRLNDEVKFSVNETEYHYVIKEITVADF